MGKLRASAQISRRSVSTDKRGTTLRRLGESPVMDSAVQVELHRQANVINEGSQINPKKYRKQEEGSACRRSGLCVSTRNGFTHFAETQ